MGICSYLTWRFTGFWQMRHAFFCVCCSVLLRHRYVYKRARRLLDDLGMAILNGFFSQFVWSLSMSMLVLFVSAGFLCRLRRYALQFWTCLRKAERRESGRGR